MDDRDRVVHAITSGVFAGVCPALVLGWELADGPVRAFEGGHLGVLFLLFAITTSGLSLIGLLFWALSRTGYRLAATVHLLVPVWLVVRVIMGFLETSP